MPKPRLLKVQRHLVLILIEMRMGVMPGANFDQEGDLDVLVLENQIRELRSFLMQITDGLYTNVQATLAPGMLSAPTEHQAAWGYLKTDGRPDFMIGYQVIAILIRPFRYFFKIRAILSAMVYVVQALLPLEAVISYM